METTALTDKDILQMNNFDLKYALDTLNKSTEVNYKKDRNYLINVIVRILDRNGN